jgi:hypothetical protein
MAWSRLLFPQGEHKLAIAARAPTCPRCRNAYRLLLDAVQPSMGKWFLPYELASKGLQENYSSS